MGDMFAGAGGFTAGAVRAATARGLDLELMAINHWQVAVSTHALNHPKFTHLCCDVYKAAPLEAVPGGRLDLLMASPTCVYYSRCRGGKPVSRDQRFGRMTPTQVLRWIGELDVQCLLLENVPEFRAWGPVGADGKPRKKRAGAYYRGFKRRLERAGYVVEDRVLNAADYGDRTTRERLFLVASRDREQVRFPAPRFSKDADGEARWRPAREVIDFALPSRSIFDKTPPYSQKTLFRLIAGAERYGWPRLLVDMIDYHRRTGRDPRKLARFRRRVDLNGLEPLVLSQQAGGAARSVASPAPTQVAKHSHRLAEPMVLIYNGRSVGRSIDEPAPTVVTKDRLALAEPLIVRTDQHKSNALCVRSVDAPAPTITTGNGLNVAQPFMPAAFGERSGQAPRTHSIDAPAPTIAATGRLNLAEPGLLVPDVFMRLWQPAELAGAMGFEGYTFVGTKTQIIRQIGNAVPVRTAAALVDALLEAA